MQSTPACLAMEVRQSHSRHWFEGIRETHSARMSSGEARYSRTGAQTKWEDPVVAAVGE